MNQKDPTAVVPRFFTHEETRIAYLNILEDMLEDKKGLQDQRKATFNILEDITEAQEELEEKFTYIKTLRALLDKLTIAVELRPVLEAVVEAYEKLLPFDSISYVIPSEAGEIVFYTQCEGSVGPKYLTHLQKQMLSFVESLPEDLEGKGEMVDGLSSDKLERRLVHGNFTEGETLQPVDAMFTSLLSSRFGKKEKRILGIFCVASTTPGIAYTKKHHTIANDIAKVVAMSLERIQVLIRSAHSRLSDLVESLPNAVAMFNQERNIIIANSIMHSIIERENRNVTLGHLISILHEGRESAEKKSGALDIDKAVEIVLLEAKTIRYEEIPVKGHVYEVIIAPVSDDEKHVSGGAIILHDITHMTEVDKMKTEFVSLASHQLRTPLTAIRWFLESLKAGYGGKLTKKGMEIVVDAHKSTKRIIRLVGDMLNMSRLEAGRIAIKPVPTNLIDFTQILIREHGSIAQEQKLTLTLRSPKKLPTIPLDPMLMREVFMNLIGNALKYTPKGGKVTVSIDLKGENIEWTVRDSGVGIPEEDQKNIFEKFYRASNAAVQYTEGTGLGLYLAKQVVELSGGTLTFTSVEGKGTTFRVTLPLEGMKAKEGGKKLEARPRDLPESPTES